MEIFSLIEGDSPLLVSSPHSGQYVPEDIVSRMTNAGRAVGDTDWHIEKLYGFAPAMGISLLHANYSRYVIDLNRDKDGSSLYPGANVTELCPTTSFNMEDIYLPNMAPQREEIVDRVARYWQPYHDALRKQIARIKAKHGYCILFEAHSIRSEVARFFEGELPALNWGTDTGKTADNALLEIAFDFFEKNAPSLSQVMNGRFKGGYITRAYGKPDENVHAMQLEMAQRVYMEETPPYAWDAEKAKLIQSHLQQLFDLFLRLEF